MNTKKTMNLKQLANEMNADMLLISQQINRIRQQHLKGQPIIKQVRELLKELEIQSSGFYQRKTIINNNNKQL